MHSCKIETLLRLQFNSYQANSRCIASLLAFEHATGEPLQASFMRKRVMFHFAGQQRPLGILKEGSSPSSIRDQFQEAYAEISLIEGYV